MKRGALSIFDALGFKGIWRRPDVSDPTEVLQKLRRLRSFAKDYLNKQCAGNPHALALDPSNILQAVRIELLSDTIAVGIARKAPEALKYTWTTAMMDDGVIRIAVEFTKDVLRQALVETPRLAYRGCISFGDFEMEENFLVGPAVDRAVELSELAQGAFIWFTPEANAAIMRPYTPQFPMLEYPVPLRGGQSYETIVISPGRLNMPDEEWDLLRSQLLDTFNNSSLDVQIKRQNTAKFLDHCKSAARAIESQQRSG